MSVIGVDIDNTLYDFGTTARDVFLEVAEERGDKTLQRGAYNPWLEWRSLGDVCGPEIAKEIVDRVHSRSVVLSRTPFEGAVETLTQLSDAGHKLRYISTRDPSCHSATLQWMVANSFPYGELICTWEDKIGHLSDAQYLIDDRPKTIVEFIYDFNWKNKHGSTNSAKQRKAFAIAFPFNLNMTDIPNLYLAPTWYGLRNYLSAKGVLQGALA